MTHRQFKTSSTVKTEDPSSSGNVFSASARGASYLILLQLFTRLLTFTFNQLILRDTNPAVFGFATIQLEFLSSTILFLSREGFRIALQRNQGDIQQTINLAYIPFFTGLFGAIIGCYGFWRSADAEVKQLGGFGSSITLYGIATVVELLCEPCFAVAQKMLLFRVRTMVEGFSVIARCAATYTSMVLLARQGRLKEFGALPFGLGQLVYAVALALGYYLVISKKVNLLPRPIPGSPYLFHRPTLWLAFSVTGQSLFKHLLTEGDKLVLTILTTPYTQGLYSVVSNYGSLVARILFQPLEETLRTILSRLLSSPVPATLEESSTLITTLLKFQLLLAVIIHTVIPPLIPSLIVRILHILIGESRFPATTLVPILFSYLYYIPIMAVNGVTESFIASVATTGDLARQSRAMVVFSVVFIVASWVLLQIFHMGGEGLVWANCINMGVRIIWSCWFIWTWYSTRKVKFGWRRILLSWGTIISAVLIGMGVRITCARGLNGSIAAVGLAGVSGLSLVGCM